MPKKKSGGKGESSGPTTAINLVEVPKVRIFDISFFVFWIVYGAKIITLDMIRLFRLSILQCSVLH